MTSLCVLPVGGIEGGGWVEVPELELELELEEPAVRSAAALAKA